MQPAALPGGRHACSSLQRTTQNARFKVSKAIGRAAGSQGPALRLASRPLRQQQPQASQPTALDELLIDGAASGELLSEWSLEDAQQHPQADVHAVACGHTSSSGGMNGLAAAELTLEAAALQERLPQQMHTAEGPASASSTGSPGEQTWQRRARTPRQRSTASPQASRNGSSTVPGQRFEQAGEAPGSLYASSMLQGDASWPQDSDAAAPQGSSRRRDGAGSGAHANRRSSSNGSSNGNNGNGSTSPGSGAAADRALTARIKGCSDWYQLRALLQLHQGALNAVHVAAAASALASLSSRFGMGPQERAALVSFLDSTFLPMASRALGTARPRELCTVLHALASLGHGPSPQWVHGFMQLAMQQLGDFNPRDAASMVWALSTVAQAMAGQSNNMAVATAAAGTGTVPAAPGSVSRRQAQVAAAVGPFLGPLLGAAQARLHASNPQDLANLALGSARLWTLCSDQAASAGPGSASQANMSDRQQGRRMLATHEWAAWRAALMRACQQQLLSCPPQALANLAHGLALLPGPPPPAQWRADFEHAALVQLPACSPHALTALAGAALRFGVPCRWGSGSFSAGLMGALDARLGDCGPQDLTDLALALPVLLMPEAAHWANEAAAGSQQQQQQYGSRGQSAHHHSRDSSSSSPQQWLQAFEAAAVERMGAFSPAQLALTLTGLSRLALASSALADQTALEQVQSSSNSSGSGSRRGRSTQAAQVEQNTVLRPSQRLLHAWFQQAARTSQGFTVLDACQSLSALASLGVVPPAAWLSEVLVSLRPKLVGAPPTSLALLCASLSKLRYKPNWQWMLSFYEATQHAAAVSVSVAESDGPTAAQGAGQGRRSLFGGAEQSDMDAPSGMPLRALGLLLSGLARLQMRPLQDWSTSVLASLSAQLGWLQRSGSWSTAGGTSSGHDDSDSATAAMPPEDAAALAQVCWGLFRLRILPGARLMSQLLTAGTQALPLLSGTQQAVLVWSLLGLSRNARAQKLQPGRVRSKQRRVRLLGAVGPLQSTRISRKAAGLRRAAPTPGEQQASSGGSGAAAAAATTVRSGEVSQQQQGCEEWRARWLARASKAWLRRAVHRQGLRGSALLGTSQHAGSSGASSQQQQQQQHPQVVGSGGDRRGELQQLLASFQSCSAPRLAGMDARSLGMSMVAVAELEGEAGSSRSRAGASAGHGSSSSIAGEADTQAMWLAAWLSAHARQLKVAGGKLHHLVGSEQGGQAEGAMPVSASTAKAAAAVASLHLAASGPLSRLLPAVQHHMVEEGSDLQARLQRWVHFAAGTAAAAMCALHSPSLSQQPGPLRSVGGALIGPWSIASSCALLGSLMRVAHASGSMRAAWHLAEPLLPSLHAHLQQQLQHHLASEEARVAEQQDGEGKAAPRRSSKQGGRHGGAAAKQSAAAQGGSKAAATPDPADGAGGGQGGRWLKPVELLDLGHALLSISSANQSSHRPESQETLLGQVCGLVAQLLQGCLEQGRLPESALARSEWVAGELQRLGGGS